jgi:ATP-dependent Clp protease protease subunit
MKKRVPLSNLFSSRVVRNYSEGWRNTRSPDARFSDRTLKNYGAANAAPTFAIAAAEGDAPTEILLYDEIGYWGVTDKDFALALAQAGNGPIKLRINSPGGDVFHGYAIYNMLVAHPAPVEVVIDGLAASAASFIAMAGTTISMAETSMLMVHNAWGIVVGDRNDMLETAAVMEKIDGQLAAIYASKSGKAAPDVSALMDAETWFTSTEAKTAGLCDAVSRCRRRPRQCSAAQDREPREGSGGERQGFAPGLRSGRRWRQRCRRSARHDQCRGGAPEHGDRVADRC